MNSSTKSMIFQFLVVFITFVIVGAPFKSLDIIPGVTELRPENAIPLLAGLTCGRIGAFACAFGNLTCDLFGTFNAYSLVGAIANFFAAYIPYKLWYLLTNEEPNVRTFARVLTVNVVALGSSAASALIIGVTYCFTQPAIGAEVTLAIFLNQYIFETIIGVPVMAVILCDTVGLTAIAERDHRILAKYSYTKRKTVFFLVLAAIAFSVLLVVLIGLVGIPATNPLVFTALIICAILFVSICF